MNDWSVDIWRSFVDSSPDGVAVCDAQQNDHPVVYVNAAFTQLTGYQASSLMGTTRTSSATPNGGGVVEGIVGDRYVASTTRRRTST